MSADISKLGRLKVLGGVEGMFESSDFDPSARIMTVVVVGGMAQGAECRLTGGVAERFREKCRFGREIV